MLISIIKIIGIIVLIIAAVVLMLLAAVLFVPLRYHIEGSFHEEKPCASASVKWMLGILSLRASYSSEDGAKAYISLFGRSIYDLLGDDTSEENIGGNDDVKNKGSVETESDIESGIKAAETVTNSVSSDNGKQDVLPAAKQLMIEDKARDAANADDAGMSDYAQNAAAAKLSEESDPESYVSGEITADTAAHLSNGSLTDDGRESVNAKAGKKNGSVSGRMTDRIKSLRLPKLITAARNRILAKLRYAADKISTAVDAAELKMKELAAQAAEIFKAVKNAFDRRSGQLNELIGLWKDERYQASKQLLISRIASLLKELRPRKGHGKLKIGFEDPYLTGQAMQIAALLYPLYGDRIEVIPDFDQSVIDGEADLKGYLRLIVPVEAAIRIFIDKGLKSMYKQARSILELD